MRRHPVSPGYSYALPIGTTLDGKYRIESMLGKPGGFGITYLARDTVLDCGVAVKEYLPRGIAGRAFDRTTIQFHSEDDRELFQHGLTRFVQEARTLARLKHPSIVGVRAFFEENATAYIIMEYTPGRTLARYLERIGGKLAPALAVEIFIRVLDGLHTAHQQGILHRDVKPENIYLTQDGRPILLDFGAARQAMVDHSQRLTTLLTPGYAPVEQYGGNNAKQGPWTDVYACAASLYLTVTGKHPPDALGRVQKDPLVPPATLVPEISPALNGAIVHGLAVSAAHRPQSAAEFQDMLESAVKHRILAAVPESVVSPKTVMKAEIEAKRPPDSAAAPPRTPGPWRRFTARLVDHLLYLVLVAVGATFFDRQTATTIFGVLIVLPGWVVTEAGFFALAGTTPGKALLGIRIRDRDGQSLTFGVAIARALHVWFVGLGATIPLVSFVTQFIAYTRLLEYGTTSWDRDRFVVTRT